MAQDSLKIKGHARFVLTDENGNIKDVREAENMIVSGGLAMIAMAMSRVTNTYICSGMGVGTGTTPVATTDINLETSAAYVALTSAGQGSEAASSHSVIYTATFNPGVGTAALTEAVICCAASAYGDKPVGNILNHLVFSVINKAAADTLAVTWTVVLADA
jgi:hypothetical protein